MHNWMVHLVSLVLNWLYEIISMCCYHTKHCDIFFIVDQQQFAAVENVCLILCVLLSLLYVVIVVLLCYCCYRCIVVVVVVENHTMANWSATSGG